MTYVELHCHSAYSFLDGASLPEELAVRAAELGYDAVALTDHDGVYGSLEFAHAAKAFGVRPITGAEVALVDGSHVTLLCESSAGYANLCRLLTAANAHTRPKPMEPPRAPLLDIELLHERNEGLVCLSGCARDGLGTSDEVLQRQFRLHLHRGISYLATPHAIRSITDLVRLAEDGGPAEEE